MNTGRPRHRVVARVLLVLSGGVALSLPGLAADSYRKLKDAEIRARLAGMETTDEVHWAEQYMRDGTYKTFSMAKVRNGKWSVRDGELCLDDGTPDLGCKEVWLSGNKVQFRTPGSTLALEGILQKQQPRR